MLPRPLLEHHGRVMFSLIFPCLKSKPPTWRKELILKKPREKERLINSTHASASYRIPSIGIGSLRRKKMAVQTFWRHNFSRLALLFTCTCVAIHPGRVELASPIELTKPLTEAPQVLMVLCELIWAVYPDLSPSRPGEELQVCLECRSPFGVDGE